MQSKTLPHTGRVRHAACAVWLAFLCTLPAQTLPPALKNAVGDLLAPGSDAALAAACRKIRAQLSGFIAEHKRPAWDELEPPATLDTAEKLAAKISQLDDGRTVDEFVRHSTEFLLRYPEHPEFAGRLWKLAAMVSAQQTAGQPSPLFDQPYLPLLFDGLAALPEENVFQLEGRLLAAQHHHHLGEFDKEEAILSAVLARDPLADPVRVAGQALLGRCFEAQERFEEALAIYAEAEDALPLYPQACDTVLRSALIHLGRGHRDKARAQLEKLAATDPALRKLARSAQDIDALLKLAAADGALEKYWDHSESWWPKWVELRAAVGHARPADELRVPDLAEAQNSSRELATAVALNDNDTFYDKLDLLMHGLRYSPALIEKAGAALTFLAPRLNPESQKQVFDFVIAVCEDLPPGDPDLSRSAQLYQTVAYSESERGDEALAVIEQFRASDSDPDELSETMTRLWAHLALAGDKALAGPRAALEELLNSGRPVQNRAQTVLYLAQILGRLELVKEEEELLGQELQNREVLADESIATGLAARFKALAQGGAGAGEFTAAVEEWIEDSAPGWLDFALPGGFDDPRIKGKELAELLADADMSGLSSEEVVKLELLAAASDKFPLELRTRAFRGALAGIYGDSPTHSAARKMLRAALRDDRFPEPLRQMLLVFSLDEALARGRKRDISNVITHPLLDRSNPRINAAARAYGRFSTCDLESAESLVECYGALAKDQIDAAELTVIAQIVERLLIIGAIDEVDKIRGAVPEWKLGADVSQTKATLRLAFLQAVKRARGAVPFARKMRELLAAHIDLSAIEPPAGAIDYRDDIDLKRLSDADAFALLVTRATGSAELQTSPTFWADLAELMPRNGKQEAFSFALIDAMLAADIPDFEKSFAVFSAPSVIDTDAPPLLERLLALFEKYRDPEGQPFTHAAMRVVEVQSRDLRQGKDIDIDAEWNGLDHPSLMNIQLPTKLRYLMARRDLTKLRAALELIPADQMLAPALADVTWPALQMAGLEDEAELAQEAVLEQLPGFIAGAARTLNFGLINSVYDTAEWLGKPELVPAGWFEYIDSQVLAERDRYSLRILDASLKKNWEEVARWATRAVSEFPTYYNYYRPQGFALHQLGKKAEAIAALEVYTKYSKDEVEWKDAMELLEKLRR